MILVSGGAGGNPFPDIKDFPASRVEIHERLEPQNGMLVRNGFIHFTGHFGVFGIFGAATHGPGTARIAGAVYTATEQGMIQDMYNILRACGFLQP